MGLHYGNCLFTSLFFTCSTALLYHSYNQLMFVNYMPFLLLALRGVDRHFQKRKSGLLILSVLGMILTSFLFFCRRAACTHGVCGDGVFEMRYRKCCV